MSTVRVIQQQSTADRRYLAGMVSYSTAKLGQVDDTYYHGVNCPSCLRAQRISLVRLRGVLGDDYRVVDVPTIFCSPDGTNLSRPVRGRRHSYECCHSTSLLSLREHVATFEQGVSPWGTATQQ